MEIIRRNTDYAIRALIYLAEHPGESVSVTEIARQQEVPVEYLQKIMQQLARSGLVRSHRGAQGGYTLARDPERITVLESVEAMQGKLTMNRCFLDRGGCPRSARCRIKEKWLPLEEQINSFLAGITLQDLIAELKGSEVIE